MDNKAGIGCPAYNGGNGCVGVDSPEEGVARMRNRTAASICGITTRMRM
jgi:hypothetical protein